MWHILHGFITWQDGAKSSKFMGPPSKDNPMGHFEPDIVEINDEILRNESSDWKTSSS